MLEKLRAAYQPPLPKILQDIDLVRFVGNTKTTSVKDDAEIHKLFPNTYGHPIVTGKVGEKRTSPPKRVGVVLSGGQAAGGHNVITGLLDALLKLNKESKLIGFLGGPSGIIDNKTKELTPQVVSSYRNQGGFDLIGSGRTKIETSEQLNQALHTVRHHQLDALVVIGGDDSNTNAAVLAEYFISHDQGTAVIGVPKTIDGDLKNSFLATSFGFDTACKTYSELIGNIARDALSAKKYTHFIKLMGRSASHIALECALATHANITLIGEEVADKKMTLAQLTSHVADIIAQRSEKGMNYGIVLVPEGLIEFIPEMGQLIAELNTLLAKQPQFDPAALSPQSRSCFAHLPEEIQKQLLFDRDPHGNVQVSLIETEKLLALAVQRELTIRSFKGKFAPQTHFFGYEGRAGFPTNFDANYCYALGYVAALLIDGGLTGYMCCIGNLHKPVHEWTVQGLPITMLMNMEMRKGKSKPVIQKALVDLKGKAFTHFAHMRNKWAMENDYQFPGPIQFFGDKALTDSIPHTMVLEAE